MNKLVLGYWPTRVLAERIRLLMEYLALDYQNELFYVRSDWFDKKKVQLLSSNPYANLPYLIDGDKVICETYAIMEYLAHKAGASHLLGTSVQEKVELAQFVGFFNDMFDTFVAFCYGKSVDFEKDKSELRVDMDNRLAKIATNLKHQKFVAGDKLTIGDIMMYDFLTVFNLLYKDGLIEQPVLKEYHNRIFSIERIKAYRESSRFKEEPVNNYYAQWSALKL